MAITTAQNSVAENYAAAGGVASEGLGAIRTVSSLNMHAYFISRYRHYLAEAMQTGIKKGFNVGLGNGAVFCAFFLTYAWGFWYGGRLVAEDMDKGCNPILDDTCITGGKVIAVFFSIVMGSFSIGQMAPALSAFTAAKAAVVPMLEVINRVPLIDGLATGESSGLAPNEPSKGDIELKDVVFCYPSRPLIRACNGYSLSIKSGQTVALVGASGSGKSTIINLLMRFYDPQEGQILLDGRNIKGLNLRWLRSMYGYVSQEPVLFSGSILDNIAYGLDSALLEPGKVPRDAELKAKVVAAAKLANAHDFISGFPDGYDTDVGSNGAAMSGGQKQRIAIARALIKKPAVLLLDEATSALDATSERMVQDSIDALQRMKAQTTIVIAHRLSTIKGADRIFVVDKGNIVAVGTHDALIAQGGLYSTLWAMQGGNQEQH
jgi:ATP-binding cassette subfamily B (MDR/TAP) protein 1